ncbi:MAG: dTDP-glucose 4,6-dehydratase [Methanomassiliicoccales archaeon]
MTRLLVTGGMGFIGSNFIRYMVQHRPEVEIVNLDKLTYAGNPQNLEGVEGRHRFVQGDICDQTLVEDLMRDCDRVVHFAAETHVDRSISRAGDFINTDVYGTYVLLEAARRHDVERFVHISTDEVYGEAGERPSLEDDPLMPKSPYAASKTGADRLAFSYHCTYGLPVTITRCANNYGPYQYPEKLIPLFVTNALEGRELPVYGSGRNTRDWIFVEDHCSAIDLLLEAPGVDGGVFNVSAQEERSVLEIAHLILSVLDRSEELIRHVDDRPGHVERHAVDPTKLSGLGWEPGYEFEDAMRRTVEWYRDNPQWWGPIKSGEFREYYREQYS